MAGFDGHKRCACCRDKLVGDDPCVIGQDCVICKGFTVEQRTRLPTPVYQGKKNEKFVTFSAPVSPARSVDSSNASIAPPLQAISTQLSALDAKLVATRTNKLEAFLVAKSAFIWRQG